MLSVLQVMEPTGLQILWFVLIGVLWLGFFVLEGFDFGVAMLYPIIGRDPGERRVMLNTIGPTWDGNEVWLITAGGAMFAAFPGWYATIFSGFYIPLFLVLFGLIIRGVSFEYRALHPDDAWRDTFDRAATVGSYLVSLVLGIAFANFVVGLPVDSGGNFNEGFLSLFNPFGLLGGVTFVVLFITHGAQWLLLKARGSVFDKASALSRRIMISAMILVTVFGLSQNLFHPNSENPYLGDWADVLGWALAALALGALGLSAAAERSHRYGVAFIGTAVSIAAIIVGIFVKIYGTLGFISLDEQNPLNMVTAASSELTLTLMRLFAFIMVPIVLAYTGWAYWVFRRRLGVHDMPSDDHSSHTLIVRPR